MAIVCTGCGREYDVTLFQLGRTIHCTCGRRVGLEHRLTLPDRRRRPRFIADAMLGKLARWLRTLGYDTAYDDAIVDETLVRRAFGEGRHILTRDRKLFEEWRVEGLLIESDGALEQLCEVVRAYDLPRPARLFTRCRECNQVLEAVALSDVEDRLPERVLERLEGEAPGPRPEELVDDSHEDVREVSPTVARCPGCERVYWEGSHTERMRRVVDRVFFDRSSGCA